MIKQHMQRPWFAKRVSLSSSSTHRNSLGTRMRRAESVDGRALVRRGCLAKRIASTLAMLKGNNLKVSETAVSSFVA